jgi:2-polyprenyl-3-methyl-5-hydroxy-6-metoxy-1,4-benzoquinol methylase
MLELAERQKQWCPTATFTCVDVLAYHGSKQFDVVLFIDVAQHYADPIGAIQEMLTRWNGTRYLISLVCGEQDEALSATTVISYHKLLRLWDEGTGMNLVRIWLERFDGAPHLGWALLELWR